MQAMDPQVLPLERPSRRAWRAEMQWHLLPDPSAARSTAGQFLGATAGAVAFMHRAPIREIVGGLPHAPGGNQIQAMI
eukprot:SAG31_NODE_13851_length_842_cov_1.411844_2_plen_77_part_01